jgi:DNA-binding NtrC family response regulator
MCLARRRVPVLIEGETGTGKEEIARLLHYEGDRGTGPFIALNCGAIQDSLFERELFGHIRGAFTDAHKTCDGLIAQADGGTLFFDEIEALSEKGQVTLLRFLQDYEIRPVGATTTRKVDVRIVGAANEDLEVRMQEGYFRPDLYFRLGVVTLSIPPLRERREDILELAEYFAADYAREYELPHKPFSAALRCYLLHYSWPGNIRELQNVIHRATLFADGANCLDVEHALRDGAREHRSESLPSLTAAKRSFYDRFERHYIEMILTETMGNVSQAARCSGKDRSAFRKLMKKHNLEREHFLAGGNHRT